MYWHYLLITLYSFTNSVLCKLQWANFSRLLAFHRFTLLQCWSVQCIGFSCSQVVRNQPSNRYGHSFDAFCGITLLFEMQNQKMQDNMNAVLVFWREWLCILVSPECALALQFNLFQTCRQCIWNTVLLLVFLRVNCSWLYTQNRIKFCFILMKKKSKKERKCNVRSQIWISSIR